MARGGIRKGIAIVAAGSSALWAAAALSQQAGTQTATPTATTPKAVTPTTGMQLGGLPQPGASQATAPQVLTRTLTQTGTQSQGLGAGPADQVPPHLVFSVTTGINADTNRNLQAGGDKAVTLDTRVGLAYAARSRLSSFDASVGALIRAGDAGKTTGNSTGTGLQEPEGKFAYSYDDKETALNFSGYYRKAQVNLFEPLTLADGTVSPTDITATTGSVISWGLQAGAELGKQDPIGFKASASTDRRHYLNNTDPGVYDSRSNSASATLRFSPNALAEYDLIFGYSTQRYSNQLATNTTQRQLGLGYNRQISPTLLLQSQIGYSRNRTNQLLFGVLPVQQRDSGLYGSLGLVDTLANGTASLTLASQRDSFGARNSIEAGRSLALPSGKLDATAGLSARAGHSAQVIGQLSYATKGPRDSVTASLSRDVSLDANNNDVAYTSASLGYSHQLTPLASLGLTLSASHAGAGGLGTATSTDRQSLQASYSYQLTEDWDLNAGYLYRHLKQTGGISASSNSVFFNVGRKFTLWP